MTNSTANGSGSKEEGDDVVPEPSKPGIATQGSDENPPFSIFTNAEKKWISSVASFGAMFSTLSSYIYFPALVPMANDLGVSVALINLTVTSYLIVAGVAPAFMGDLADQGGRRPAYLLMFALVVASNIGLALQDSYPALFVLRMVQSAGASGSYGAAYGIVADITTVSERGSYVGSLIFFTGAAPSFGPVIAGVLAQKLGWRWIFWFLVILTGTYLVVVMLLLPETQRKVVGNGSIPTKGIHRSLFDKFTSDRRRTDEGRPDGENRVRKQRRCHFPNPLKGIPMLLKKGNLMVILIGSVTYTVKMVLQMSLAAECIEIYHLDYLQAGLIYLPSGVGGAIAAYGTGRLLDWNLKTATARYAQALGYRREDGIANFPIERVRFAGIYTLIAVSAVGTAAYGVTLNERTVGVFSPRALLNQNVAVPGTIGFHADNPKHIAAPLVLQFITGATTSSLFTLCGTLLTDLNPHAFATVQASYNLVRCIGAGIGIAVQEPLADAAGSGWCFGIFSIVMLLPLPLAGIIKKHGLEWRKEKVVNQSHGPELTPEKTAPV